MSTLTREQRQLLKAGGEPPWLVDPDTSVEYVLLKAEIYA